MKILQLNFAKTWRGGERQTLFCMQGFRKAGQEVSLLCRSGYPLANKSIEENFDTHAFDTIFQVIKFLIINGNKFDVIHAQTAHILTYCLLTKPFHRSKVVYTRRVDFVPSGFFTLIKYKLTDKLIAISSAIKTIINQFSHRNAVLIPSVIVPRRLDMQRAEAELRGMNVPEGSKIIGTVAALVQHKDPLTMVEAVRLLKEKRTDFIFLHFGVGDLEDIVKQKIKEYQLDEYYRLVGFKENVEDFYSQLEVFVMSSEEEGLGSSVLDAFLYRVPVVSTDAGGLSDLVSSGHAISCRVKDTESLANGINAILQDTKQYKIMVEKAYDYVIKEHNIDILTERYIELFKKLLAKK